MADEADSKSVAGNRVWVQVPPPALREMLETLIKWALLKYLFFASLITLDNFIKIQERRNSFVCGMFFF